MNVWRITIKTDAVEGVDPRRFCLERNILGVGWPVDGPQSLDWDTYHALGTAKYYDDGDKGWWPAVNAIRNRMTEGDLCWTRDWEGNYYLGRVAGRMGVPGDAGAHRRGCCQREVLPLEEGWDGGFGAGEGT